MRTLSFSHPVKSLSHTLICHTQVHPLFPTSLTTSTSCSYLPCRSTMNSWNQPQAAPQLEQEYSLDSHLLDIGQSANPTTNHFYQHVHPSRPGVHGQGSSHVSGFTNFGSAPGQGQTSYNFGSPQNQAGPSQSSFDSTYYSSSVNGPALQAQNAFSGQISQYGGSPSPSMVHAQAQQYQTSPPGGYSEGAFDNTAFVPSVPSNAPTMGQRYSPNPLGPDIMQQMQSRGPPYPTNESVNEGDGNDESRPEPLRKP